MATSSEAQKLLILELATRLLKSWWTVVTGICVGLAAALVALQYTTELYEARATIAADVERLPAEFIRRTISEDLEVQLRALRGAVLSPTNLKTVISNAFGTPESDEEESLLMEGIELRSRLSFDRSTRALSVFYSDVDPYRAADVTNTLAELFVQENMEMRAESARMVRKSLENLSSDVGAELQEKRAELGQLLAEHVHELESERFSNNQRIMKLREDLKTNEEALSSARSRFEVLEAQRIQEQPQVPSKQPSSSPSPATTTDPRILEIEEEIENLLNQFTENHPDVVAKRREMERIRESIRNRESDNEPPEDAEHTIPPEVASVPALDIWQTRLRAAELDVSRLEAEGRTIRREIATYEGYLANTPSTQRQVDDLQERVRFLQEQSRQNLQKIETAKSGEQLEEEELANPFMITSYAGPPSVPAYPDRMKYLGTGAVGGLVLFVGPLLVGGFLRPRVMFEMSLRALADVPILAAIPEIPTEASIRRERLVRWRNVGLSTLAISALCIVWTLEHLDLI